MSFQYEEDINPLWQLADPLTVTQASALIAGFDPNFVRFDTKMENAWFERDGYTQSDGINWVLTAFAALSNAINARLLKATIKYDADPAYRVSFDILNDAETIEDLDGAKYVISAIPNWSKSTVSRSDLIEWLESKNFHTGFFFAAKSDDPDYLNPKHPRYAPKLAAAVQAWKAVTDANGKHPKQALEKWLREHAAEFGMTNEEGKLNETGIDEVAKVANWQPGGGAPKTTG